LGIFDLLGVALLGVIGALAIRGVESKTPGSRVQWIISHLGLGNFSFRAQIVIITSSAISFLILKTIASIYLSRRILFFLAHRSAEISANLVENTLTGELEDVLNKNTLELQYAVGPGVNYIALGVIGLGTTVVSDATLLIILSTGLLIIDPFTFLTVTVMFGLIGLALYKLLHSRAREVGIQIAQFNIESNRILSESLLAFREIYIRNKQDYYSAEIAKLKLGFSRANAEQTFLPNVSKYIVEISVTLGAVIVAGIEFATQDASRAVAGLALFVAAGSRIAPALLRIQQSLIQIQGNIGGSTPTLNLIKELQNKPERKISSNSTGEIFQGHVKFENVTFQYKRSDSPVLSSVDFEIKPGELVAIVGPSGSGKSTLIDLMLGLLDPTKGEVKISGMPPKLAVQNWHNSISYVPQDVAVFEESVKKNIAIGGDPEGIDEERVVEVLKKTQLDSLVWSLPKGVSDVLAENGSNLSGGQKQRLGIARALYSDPSLLILDEATSALDGKTESDITDMILGLKGTLTLIIVAHRLSTVRNADKIIYLDGGKIREIGTFDELRAKISDFDEQARLMGL
jgi:ABC-type multidrug transport system fused ATPase/permease subunit